MGCNQKLDVKWTAGNANGFVLFTSTLQGPKRVELMTIQRYNIMQLVYRNRESIVEWDQWNGKLERMKEEEEDVSL